MVDVKDFKVVTNNSDIVKTHFLSHELAVVIIGYSLSTEFISFTGPRQLPGRTIFPFVSARSSALFSLHGLEGRNTNRVPNSSSSVVYSLVEVRSSASKLSTLSNA